jgi:hypothetical protein
MSSQAFAEIARREPKPYQTIHKNDWPTNYTCHMAVMHWAFMDLGDDQHTAHARVEAIILGTCRGCTKGSDNHDSIDAKWYGSHFYVGNFAVVIAGCEDLHARVTVGDVLFTSEAAYPMHSMVVVGKKSEGRGRRFVCIRGFNNLGTLGTGVRSQYDNMDRNIDDDQYWRGEDSEMRFGQKATLGHPLCYIPYFRFIDRARVVRGNCNKVGGTWSYRGPTGP